MAFVIGALTVVIFAQWLLIWRLIDRLLFQSKIPSLGPVRVPRAIEQMLNAQQEEKGQEPPARRKLFTAKVPD